MKRHQPFNPNPRRRKSPDISVGASRINHAIVQVQAPGVMVTVHSHQVDALGHPMTTVEIVAEGDAFPQRGKPWWIEAEHGNRRQKARIIQREKL